MEGTPHSPEQRTYMADRARAVMDQVNELRHDEPDAPLARMTPGGEVVIGRIELKTWPGGYTSLEIWVHGDTVSGDPHFRIFNPPLLVLDPAGPIIRGERRFRHDPLLAVAVVIGQTGGARRGSVDVTRSTDGRVL